MIPRLVCRRWGSAQGWALGFNPPLFLCVAGLADPSALTQAVAAYQGCHFIGMPECEVRPFRMAPPWAWTAEEAAWLSDARLGA